MRVLIVGNSGSGKSHRAKSLAEHASLEAQQSKLAFLLEWVALYYSRDGVRSYAYHRRVFDAFDGNKTEVVQLG
jgi:adenylate kinase family enzyme